MDLKVSDLVETVYPIRGRQLRSYKSKIKPTSLKPFPEMSIRGKAEEILLISPRVKQLESHNYLKNVSKIKSFAPLITTATQSEAFTNTQSEEYNKILNERSKKLIKIEKNKEKNIPLNVNSKFSIYLRKLQEEKLRKMNKELFPEELCEEIEYVPEYFESILKEPLNLEASTMTQRSRVVQYNTVKNVTRSSFFPRTVDSVTIERSKFTTYEVDWRVNKSEIGSLPERKKILPALTERRNRSTDRKNFENVFNL